MLESDSHSIKKFISELPVRKIPGIGNVTEHILSGLGIKTCGDILLKKLDIYTVFKQSSS